MHVIARPTLISFWVKYPESEVALKVWFKKVTNAKWKNINDLKKDFPYSDYVGNNRVVFNIKGNNFRLISVVYFDGQKIYIRFIGTHAEYDKINAKTI
jgi:mRNA interferase HigB